MEALDRLLEPAVRRNPFPYYRQLTARPPMLSADPAVVLVSDHASCERALLDDALSTDQAHCDRLAERSGAAFLDWPDAPASVRAVPFAFADHRAAPPERRAIVRGLAGGAAEGLRPEVARIVSGALDALGSTARQVDLVRELTRPIARELARAMLGLPLAAAPRVEDGAEAVMALLDRVADATVLLRTEPGPLPAALRERVTAFHLLVDGALDHLPGTALTHALRALREVSPDRATLVATAVLVAEAAYESVGHFLANCLHAVLVGQHVLRGLRRDREFAGPVVEEALRWCPSAHVVVRYAAGPTAIGRGGRRTPVAPGTVVLLNLAAANRDPRVFAEPDTFDPWRPDAARHLGLGHGPHYCVGAALARQAAGELLAQFAERVRDPLLAGADPAGLLRRDNLLVHGLLALPAVIGGVRPARAPAGAVR